MVASSIQHCEQTLMFTDIVGYSRLMGRNEALAVEMLGDYRSILLSHIEGQRGKLVEFVGDAIFARFDTATAAVAAAIAIQQHLLAFNDARDKKLPPLQTRIGLHKGEIMLRDGAVFGDSVNIAARLEPLAVADGICISQAVYDEIRLKLSSPAKRLGTQTLKNIQQKVRAYLIKPSGIGWRDHLHYFICALKRRIFAYRYPLSLALLVVIAAGVYFVPRWLVPGYAANYVEIADFKNLMNEKGDADYFSAGITEAVRSQLADMRDVYIVDAKEGIHAPIRLEGSVQKLGDNLRIAYRLFRRKDNVQIVGGKLDGTYQDIFILQDRLVGEIARYLAAEFKLQNFRPAPLRLTNDITAYDFYLQGLDFLEKPATHQNMDLSIQRFNTALVHDGDFASAHSGLCKAYWKKYEITKHSQWLTEAEASCTRALAQDSRSSATYKSIGAIYMDTGRYEKAIEYLQQGRLLDNHDVATSVTLALAYHFSGQDALAERLYREIIELSPKNWKAYFGYGYFLTRLGRHDEALENFRAVLKITPDNILAMTNMANNYLFKGDFEKAAELYEESTRFEPSSAAFANVGTTFYLAEDFEKAVEFYDKSLKLEPTNYQWLIYLGDAYKFMPSKKEYAEKYFSDAIQLIEKEFSDNTAIARTYHHLARCLVFFGNIDEAKKIMILADKLDGASAESYYTHLRIAVSSGADDDIIVYARKLLRTEYSEELLLSDPDFKVLKESRFKNIFD